MQRIERLAEATVPQAAADLLAAARRQMGGVPYLLTTLAHSPAALGAYLGFAGALAGGVLDSKLREQIAVAVAGGNQCDYCASAHFALGRKAGVTTEELQQNLGSRSGEPKTGAALAFVARVLESRGQVSDADLAAVRAAGFSEAEVVEIVAHVGMNVFTNYFNHVAQTEIDFPPVRTGA